MSAETWIAHHSDGSHCEQATTTHDCPRSHEYTRVASYGSELREDDAPTLNDELATEARRVALLGVASLARRGTRHDPEL